MQDRSADGLRLLLLALLPGVIATVSQDPVIKLAAAMATVAIVTRANDYFQATARESYWQLRTAPERRQLPPGY